MKLLNVVLPMLVISWQSSALAETSSTLCQSDGTVDLSKVISCHQENIALKPVSYSLVSKETVQQIRVHQYQMISQSWSPNGMVHPDQWQHDIDIYIPAAPKLRAALIAVNNGTNYANGAATKGGPSDFTADALATIARSTNTIVIAVNNIPNQALTYGKDAEGLREDDNVARSWTLFMEKPEQRELLPLQVPMATAVSQAISVAKQELAPWNIDKFIITGASKRGWASWLTALSNNDVVAIVPFVTDLLGTQQALEHIYLSYGKNWPVAFYPYYQQGIDKEVKTVAFGKLMRIIDPLQYNLQENNARLKMPKYIINASGDDFYVPDNARFYYDELPGEKSLRVVPNTGHFGIKGYMEQSLITFLHRFHANKTMPEVSASAKDNTLTVNFSEKPQKITRWTAINASDRDFRYACDIRYTPTPIHSGADNTVTLALGHATSGWEATFVEAIFDDGYVATTQVYITPDGRYPDKAPASNDAACKTLPGRGLGEK